MFRLNYPRPKGGGVTLQEEGRLSNKRFLIFIILGLAILSVPFFRHHRDAKEAEQYIDEIGDTEDEAKEKTEEKAEATGGKKKTAKAIPEGAIGIIEIKSLNIRYPIFEGAGSAQLNSGIGHLTESAGLLEKGNCVLAGHNGSRRGVFFTYLSGIQMGAKVTITNKEKESHTYEVVDTSIVGPYDESVRAESDEECLTLFTCAYHGSRRFVCRCRVVEDNSQ